MPLLFDLLAAGILFMLCISCCELAISPPTNRDAITTPDSNSLHRMITFRMLTSDFIKAIGNEVTEGRGPN